ncbi:MAG: hypothetical protein ABI172_00365 [Ginsengibacter sp.]|jgi:ketosteroid isomerase-like protein
MNLLALKNIFLVGAFSLILFACNENDKLDIERSASAFDIKQGEASIKQSNLHFMKSFRINDSVEVANCFTTNAKLMIADMPAIEGRDNIKHFITLAMSKGITNFELKTIKIWGDSSILAEEGAYKFLDHDDNQLDKGKYIVLWKQEAGNWKMFRDILTSDIPPSALVNEKSEVHKKRLRK